MSLNEIVSAMIERNEQLRDPIMGQYINALITKLPQTISEAVEGEKRGRSLVIYGIPESADELPPSSKQREVEAKVTEILDVLGVECRPSEVYRMGRPGGPHPRLVKLVLPAKGHWITAISNSHRLRNSSWSNVFVRRSLTKEERDREFHLREECRARNKQLGHREWAVYRGELSRVDDLRKSRISENA
uniref:Transposase_22 domain-containing protein n=1 Tax=Haemonchus contortus TaxID=6289 RepID=A0A7I4YTI5_HAECO